MGRMGYSAGLGRVGTPRRPGSRGIAVARNAVRRVAQPAWRPEVRPPASTAERDSASGLGKRPRTDSGPQYPGSVLDWYREVGGRSPTLQHKDLVGARGLGTPVPGSSSVAPSPWAARAPRSTWVASHEGTDEKRRLLDEVVGTTAGRAHARRRTSQPTAVGIRVGALQSCRRTREAGTRGPRNGRRDRAEPLASPTRRGRRAMQDGARRPDWPPPPVAGAAGEPRLPALPCRARL
jgi:hypothetical protein